MGGTMAKKIALLTLHGMGDTAKTYHEELIDDVKDRVGAAAWSEVHFASIYYANVFQPFQEDLFDRVASKVDNKKLRRFLLYGFSDAGGLEHSRSIPNSAYREVQKRIFDAMGKAYAALGGSAPVVMIAQSLGCQVISNYIWDAQSHTRGKRPPGIWKDDHGGLDPRDLKFRKFASLRVLMTTGCNIPIFVGGLPPKRIIPIKKPNGKFVWENYYDEDDPLGWPLQDLSTGYSKLVRDIEISAGGPLTRWNAFSHSQYWGDSDVQEPLARHLLALLGRR